MDLTGPGLAAEAVVASLGLAPHPEGGFYREIFRDGDLDNRGAATGIYFLLPRGVVSHWHKVDAVEIWLWHAGAPLALEMAAPDAAATHHPLGPDLSRGEALQRTVPKGHWQRAWSDGDWTLVSCIVAPAFLFAGFEMAPAGWNPPG
jgi:predicted cupin superfamily sugar epimerase